MLPEIPKRKVSCLRTSPHINVSVTHRGPDFLKCMTFKSFEKRCETKMLFKKPPLQHVTSQTWTKFSHKKHVSHTYKRTHIHLTHKHASQEHSAQLLLRCKWFASMHHWPNAVPSPPLFSTQPCLTLSISAAPLALLSLFALTLLALFLLCFSYNLSPCPLLAVRLSFQFVFSVLSQPLGLPCNCIFSFLLIRSYIIWNYIYIVQLQF